MNISNEMMSYQMGRQFLVLWINQAMDLSIEADVLTHWSGVICVGKLTIIGSDNGLSPTRRQAIIWTNDGRFLNGPIGTNLKEVLIEIDNITFSFKKIHFKMSSGKWRPLCRGSMC